MWDSGNVSFRNGAETARQGLESSLNGTVNTFHRVTDQFTQVHRACLRSKALCLVKRCARGIRFKDDRLHIMRTVDEKKQLLQRHRIEGQVGGLRNMIAIRATKSSKRAPSPPQCGRSR
jgi:hypothetical protein